MNMLKKFGPVLFLPLMLIVLVGLSLITQPDFSVQAAPPAVPTPLSISHSAENVNAPIKFWADGTVVTQSGASSEFILAQAEALDIQTVIVQPSPVNTLTLTLQFSNDGTNWVNGIDLLTNNVAATVNDLNQYNNFGYRTRLNLTLANSGAVTLTHVSATARR